MNIINSLEWRYATKKFNPSKKLSNQQINTLKSAFNLTPTSFGLQPVKMIVICNKELQEKFKLTYLFITHDLRIVRHVADHVMVMRHGKLVEEGKTHIIFKNPKNQYTKDLIQSIPGLISKRN